MTMLIMIGEDVVREALMHAKPQLPAYAFEVGALRTAAGSAEARWIEKLWNTAQEAILTATGHGIAAAREWIEKVEAIIESVQNEISESASDVIAEVTRRLQAASGALVEQSVQRCIVTVKIGGNEMRISEVTIGQTLKFSGSLSASLTKLCEFVAEGTITVSAKYVAVQATNEPTVHDGGAR